MFVKFLLKNVRRVKYFFICIINQCRQKAIGCFLASVIYTRGLLRKSYLIPKVLTQLAGLLGKLIFDANFHVLRPLSEETLKHTE